MTKFLITIITILNTILYSSQNFDYIGGPRLFIVDGLTSYNYEELSYLAFLKYTDWGQVSHCCGTFIHLKWILTAAHCLTVKPESSHAKIQTRNPKSFDIGYGSFEFRRLKILRNSVAQLYVHPAYRKHDYSAAENCDVGLLQLKKLINSEEVNLAKIADKKLIYPSIVGILAGFGQTLKEPVPRQLQWIKIQVISSLRCYLDHSFLATQRDIYCGVGLRNGQNICSGDSGTGVIRKINENGTLIDYVFGIAIATPDQNCSIPPTLFIDVYYHRQWISNVQETCNSGNSKTNKSFTLFVIFIFIHMC